MRCGGTHVIDNDNGTGTGIQAAPLTTDGLIQANIVSWGARKADELALTHYRLAHAVCNAHHLRESKALTDLEKEPWAKKMS